MNSKSRSFTTLFILQNVSFSLPVYSLLYSPSATPLYLAV